MDKRFLVLILIFGWCGSLFCVQGSQASTKSGFIARMVVRLLQPSIDHAIQEVRGNVDQVIACMIKTGAFALAGSVVCGAGVIFFAKNARQKKLSSTDAIVSAACVMGGFMLICLSPRLGRLRL